MTTLEPLVTIGIPTYNRAHLLSRSIDSALRQSHTNIEVLVSDNASTDRTESICETYLAGDSRFRYIRLASNLGATANFNEVLKNATGEYFLWLGDDDWLDESYVERCVYELVNDLSLAIVYGTPRYYKNSLFSHCGSTFELRDNNWWKRVIWYYIKVIDNGMFYGVTRTKSIRELSFKNTMGGDWMFVANLLCSGSVKILRELSVHRELGGASSSPKAIAESLRLPTSQLRFPTISIAIGALIDITSDGIGYREKPRLARLFVGITVLLIIIIRHSKIYMHAAIRLTKARILRQPVRK